MTDDTGMKGLYWKLDDQGEPVECSNVFEWAVWLEANRDSLRIKTTVLRSGGTSVRISTVFMGVVANVGPPMLYETMVFFDEDDNRVFGEMERYRTKAKAIKGHDKLVKKYLDAQTVQEAIKENKDE